MARRTSSSVRSRFYANVDREGLVPSHRPELGPCSLWTAGTTSGGYGAIWVNGKLELAHRVAYELEVGPIPDGMLVLHRCDVRACVRGAHLFTGSHGANSADMAAKGRSTAGARNPAAKLSDEQAEAIRARRAAGEELAPLAEEFGVAVSTVSRIGAGKRKAGSVRFAEYFKVQWWEERSLAWRDVQRAHGSEEEAREAFLEGLRCRVMRVAPEGRAPLPE